MDYEIVIEWDRTDEIFVARVPAFLGCMAHGETRQEVESNIQEAIALRLETDKEFGDAKNN